MIRSAHSVVTISSGATSASRRRVVALQRGQGADGVRFGHRQPAPGGAIGGPLHLQLRSDPGSNAGASELARHQAAGTAAARQGGRSSPTNPRRNLSRSGLGTDSAAKASPFRVAEARLLAAQPLRVGPFSVGTATSYLKPMGSPPSSAMSQIVRRMPTVTSIAMLAPPVLPSCAVCLHPITAGLIGLNWTATAVGGVAVEAGAASGATDTLRRRLVAARHGQGADGVRVEHRQPAPEGAIGGPLQLQRRSSPGSSTSATETAQHQTAGAAAARQGGRSSPTNPHRHRSSSGLE